MKSKILYIGLFLISISIHAQGNLQFNQPLLLSTTNSSTVLLGTVPAGKAWKIEGYGTEVQGANSCGFSFNGSNVAFYSGTTYTYGSNYTYSNNNTDFWLPAGATLYALSGCGASYRWVSILEFNIVP
jgi:hypothetical protein